MIRVLVVEDSPTWAKKLTLLLESDGEIKVVGHATNGRQAVEMAADLRPDLITMDVVIPDMDGLEVARQIGCAAPGIPVLMVSGYFYKDDPAIQAALEQGLICGFVEKPFSHGAIIAAMETALGSQAPTDLTCLPAVRYSEISS